MGYCTRGCSVHGKGKMGLERAGMLVLGVRSPVQPGMPVHAWLATLHAAKSPPLFPA